jgi:hypothetical protein
VLLLIRLHREQNSNYRVFNNLALIHFLTMWCLLGHLLRSLKSIRSHRTLGSPRLHCHGELEWKFWFIIWLGWSTTHINDSYIPLDFLSIKDLKKLKKAKKVFEGQIQSLKPKMSIFHNFFPWFGSFRVNLIEKATDLSLKAIKVPVEPYIGQTSNLVWWIQIFLILPFQYQQG